MMQFCKKLLLLILVLGLVGCGVRPQLFGISKAKWRSFSVQQQKSIIADYKYIQLRAQKQKIKLGSSWLQVKVSEGKAMMFPFERDYGYIPVSMKLQEGSCSSAKLWQRSGRHFVDLFICYRNSALLLDPSLHQIDKADGSVKLYANPLWKNGFTYRNISTSGYTRLQNTNITVKLENVSNKKRK